MSDFNAVPGSATRRFIERVFSNDSTKRGFAAAAAGVLVALISETIWPSS